MSQNSQEITKSSLTFGDLFAGCGGLSLGLIKAGWNGCFAIEKNAEAFETLRVNLVSGQHRGFDWPEWLPMQPTDITDFAHQYDEDLTNLKGNLTLLAGGPPCQGFSLAGGRSSDDPRNTLTEEYINVVQKLEPRFLLIENVQGFTLPFKKNGVGISKAVPYSLQVIEKLEKLGYVVFTKVVDFSRYGVPQQRQRFILIAIRKNDPAFGKLNGKTPFDLLEANRVNFLAAKGLTSESPITVRDAIGDLEVSGKRIVDSDDSPIKGFQQIEHDANNFKTPFIELMRDNFEGAPNSLRLPRHSPTTVAQFKRIMETCDLGRTISSEDRKRLGIRKRAITPLGEDLPSGTVTTLPDDIIHYSEPRILTVRENARLQTFPDWFRFTGNYTTGGANRKNSCPRYTQVGNAVPPLFAEAIGSILMELAS